MTESLVPTQAELKEFVERNLPPQLVPAKSEEAPQRKHIGLAILSYDGKVYLRTMMSILMAIQQCGAQRWGFNIVNREGDSMVARGRSFLASQFLENPGMADCTDLVFIDTDLVWGADEFVRLCSHNVDVVGAAYPYKNDGGDFPLRWLPTGIVEENGLWQVQAVTPGFMKISRKALSRIVLEKPYLEFRDRDNPEGQRSWMFFDNAARQTGVYDEGYLFCEHWRGCGGTVYLDPDIELGHIGMKEYRPDHKTVRGWLDKKTETLGKLYHEHPNIPPLILVRKTMGEDIDVVKEAERLKAQEAKLEADNDHRDAQPAGTAVANGQGHAAECEPGGHENPPRRGRGRPRKPGQPEAPTKGRSANGVGQAAGG
jgi:hypothetical protein